MDKSFDELLTWAYLGEVWGRAHARPDARGRDVRGMRTTTCSYFAPWSREPARPSNTLFLSRSSTVDVTDAVSRGQGVRAGAGGEPGLGWLHARDA